MDREAIVDLFSAFGPVSPRRMFSGFGLYADDVCFSLFLRGELYLKADETTEPRFEAEGSRPFSYTQPKSGKVVVVKSYWTLPERLYDDPDELAQWARQALAVARAKAVLKKTPKTARVETAKRPRKRQSKKKAGRNPRL